MDRYACRARAPRRQRSRSDCGVGCVKSTWTTWRSPPSKNVCSRAAGVVDQLMRQHEVATAYVGGDGADRGHRENRRHPALLQRPQVGAVVDPVRRNRVSVPVARQKNDVAPGDLAEDQRRRRLPVGRAYDFAVRYGKRRQAGKPAATDDGKHGI